MTQQKDKYKSSFGVIRANPRISGNLKLSVDSSQNIWLNSIDSNSEMSKNQYKGYRLSPDGDFPLDVYHFFNEGKTPTNYIFGINGEDSIRDTYTESLEDQYDGTYNMGVTPLISGIYNEDFSYLAPLYLGKDIPKYFVIFRIDDPIDFSYVIKVNSLTSGKSYKVLEDYGLDTAASTYKPYTVESDGVQYTSGTIFTATTGIFTVIQGIGSITLFDPNYNIPLVGDIQNHFVDNILPKSSVVATFSLNSDSKVGKYIRKIQSNKNYSSDLINIKFEDQALSTYNGVSIKDGVFCKKGEYLNKDFTNDSTIIEFDQLITDGFKRNDVISYNLLNLEFLFNDADADLYSINRYYGLYVDDIPTGSFQLSGDLFYKDSYSIGNLPAPKNKTQISNKMPASFFQKNDNGIRLFIDQNSKWGYLPSSDDTHVNERLKMFYIKDKNENFYSYKQIKDYGSSATDTDKWGTGSSQDNLVILKNKLLDLSLFSGIDKTKTKEYKAKMTQTTGRSYSILRIAGELLPGDAIVLYHPFGSNVIGNKRFDYFVASALTYLIGGWGPGSFINSDGAYYFHPFGTNAEIAKSISGILNTVEYKSYRAFHIDDEVVIRTNGSDSKIDETYSLYVYKDFYNKAKFDAQGKIFINEIDGVDINTDIKFIGGSKYTNTRIKVKKGDANKITAGKSYIKTNSGYSLVKSIGKCIDYNDYELQKELIKDYSTHSIIEISDHTHTILLGTSETIMVEELANIETGVFSMYGLKDLDIDFWSSTYGRTPTEEYYRYLDVQPNGITPIYNGIDYAVAKGAIVEYMGNTYGPDSNFIFRGGTGTGYTLIQSSTVSRANVIPTLYLNPDIINEAISSGLNNPQVDIDKFPGFIGLQEIKFLSDISSISTKKDQMNFGKADSEYDVLKENYLKNLVTLSRVTPYITKWVYSGGSDVRGNDYRLNCSPAFTPLNFSPSFFSPGRDPLYFTNEWYLLENPPISATPNLLKNNSSYCAGVILLSELEKADPSLPDYFLNYFTIDGKDYYDIDNIRFSDLVSKPIEERYTYFNFDSASGFSETLFRGIKLRIKERTDSSLQTKERNLFKIGDKKLDGYKFSCILKSIEDPDPYHVTSPVTFDVHQNDTFKHVTFIITIVNNDSRFTDLEKLSNLLYNVAGEANVEFSNSTGSYYYNPTGIYGDSDYFGLYSIKDKYRNSIYKTYHSGDTIFYTDYLKINNGGIIFSTIGDVKLSAGLNMSSRATIGIEPYVDVASIGGLGIVPIAVNHSYDTDLREEVKFYSPNTPYNLGGIGFRNAYTLFSPSAITPGLNSFSIPWPIGAGKKYLNFKDVSYSDYYFDFTGLGYPPPSFTRVPVPIPYSKFSDSAVYQAKTGNGYWDSVLNKISFPEIYNLFINDSRSINYTRSYWDSVNNTTVIDNGTFILEFIKPSSFLQTARKIPIQDNYKPDAYTNTTIGYELIEEKSISEFFRYSGGYSPKFRDILFFDNLKIENLKSDINPSQNGVLDITIKLVQKTDTSKYQGIGSQYEIYIDGVSRKKLRFVKGNTYNLIFENFVSTGYVGAFPIKKDFIISSVENSGNISNVYSSGFTYKNTHDGATFIVPENSPSGLFYELSGEDYSGGSILITENLRFKNVTFGTGKDSFGFINNVSYYKYSTTNISKIDPNSGYKLQYPLIGETPVDKRKISIFESTWDAGRYKQYLDPTTYQDLPGTKNLVEEKSFFGSKAMKTPNLMKHPVQIKYASQISDVFNTDITLYPSYEILWEETASEIKALLLVNRTVIKHFRDGGIDKKFSSILVPEFGLKNSSDLTVDTNAYIESNIIPEYEVKDLGVYIKKIQASSTNILEPIVSNLLDFDKISNGYVKSTNNNITKAGSLVYHYTLQKDPSYNYSVAFSFLVGKI